MLHVAAPLLAYSTNHDQALFIARNQKVLGRYSLGPLVRDPFVSRGLDGRWHVLFTESWNSTRIGHSASDDLRHWEPANFPEVHPDAHNCWAPEFMVDSTYFVFWASRSPERQCIWCARSLDLHHFSEPRLLFNPGYDVIDATIQGTGTNYRMAFKDERKGVKAIRITTAPRLEGPYGDVSAVLTPPDTEGPIFWNGGLVYDAYRDNSWGSTTGSFWAPPDARHGCVFVSPTGTP